jgi:predicted transcriptional regulator
MTLTEEQRAALKRVLAYMNRMYGIASPYYGCTEDANILRAMIDSSEHFTDATKMIGFDLEKARAVDIDLLAATDWGELRRHYCAALAEIERLRAIIDTPSEEPEWVVDFKKLNRFAGVGYSLIDIEIAKKWHTAYRKAQNSNLLRKQEIERLRAEISEQKGMIWKTQQVEKEQDAQIRELKADLEQSERVVEARLDVIDEQAIQIKALERGSINQAARIRELEKNCIYDPEQGKIFVPDGYPELEKLRARVSELEDALVEDRAVDIAYDEGHLWSRLLQVDGGQRQEEYRERARSQLQLEGKIWPDAKPNHVCVFQNLNKSDAITITGPHGKDHYLAEQKVAFCIQNFRGCHQHKCWQITEERKEAIRDAEIALRDAVLDSNDPHCWDAETAVLRAMLEEAA